MCPFGNLKQKSYKDNFPRNFFKIVHLVQQSSLAFSANRTISLNTGNTTQSLDFGFLSADDVGTDELFGIGGADTGELGGDELGVII